MDIERVRVIRKDKELPIPMYHTKGSVGFDMYCRDSVTIQPKEIGIVHLNNVIEVPKGYALFMFSRSSTPLKKGLIMANSVGIFDQDFCGPENEMKAMFYNITDAPVKIEKGERIVQGIFVSVIKSEFEDVDEIVKENRGEFGSTGGHK